MIYSVQHVPLARRRAATAPRRSRRRVRSGRARQPGRRRDDRRGRGHARGPRAGRLDRPGRERPSTCPRPRRASRWPIPASWARRQPRSALAVAAGDDGRAVVAWSRLVSTHRRREQAIAATAPRRPGAAAAVARRRRAAPDRPRRAPPQAGRARRGCRARAADAPAVALERPATLSAASGARAAPRWLVTRLPLSRDTGALRADPEEEEPCAVGPRARSRGVVVLRRPARDLARRRHVHRLDLHDRQRLGRPLHGRAASSRKRVIFKGLGRDDHNNPSLVFRRDGHIMVFFSPHSGHHLPPPGHPERDALHGVVEPVLDRRLRAGAHGRRPTSPAASGYTYPNPIQLKDKLWLFWRGGDVEPDVLLHRGRHPLGARPASSCTSGTGSGPTRSTSATATAGSTASSPTATRRTGRTACTTCATRPATSTRASGRRLGTLEVVPLHTSKLDHIYNYSDARRARLGPRHRAHRRGPAAGRLHAPRRQPRHLLVRLPQRHAVDQPQDRRGRRRPPVVPLRRRDARPRGPALRLPVAHDRPLEPGRAVVHARRRPHVDAPAADQRPDGLHHPPGHAARAHAGANRILYVWGDERTIGFTNYRTRIHALDF